MGPPSGRFSALHDAPPPSSPEFTIRKPYNDDGREAKRRKSSRILKTYSQRSRRLPTIPLAMRSHEARAHAGIDLPSDGNLSTSSSIRDPVSSDSIIPAFPSSPPSSPPLPQLRRSPRRPPARMPLAPIFLSLNEKREAVSEGVKGEDDIKREAAVVKNSRGNLDTKPIKMEHGSSLEVNGHSSIPGFGRSFFSQENPRAKPTLKSEPVVKDEPSQFKHEDEVELAIKDEASDVKIEPQVKREWPIFSRASRTLQPRASTKNEPEVKHELGARTVKTEGRMKRDPGHHLETPIKHEPGIKRERHEPCGQSPATRGPLSWGSFSFGGANFSPQGLELKDEIVKSDPVPLKTEPGVKSEEVAQFKHDSDGDLKTALGLVGSSRAGVKEEGNDRIWPKTEHVPDASIKKEEEEEESVRQDLSYNLPYKQYLTASHQASHQASRQQNPASTTSSGRSKSTKRKVQATLNLSTKVAFKECKLCDTVYNPLHPADVKLHQEVHERVVRASGLGNWAQTRKRRRV